MLQWRPYWIVPNPTTRGTPTCLWWFLKTLHPYLSPCKISKTCHQVHDFINWLPATVWSEQKISWRFQLWNNILSANINPNVSEFYFFGSHKAAICNNLCTTRVDVKLLLMPFSVIFCVAPSAPMLKYICYMWKRQGAHKSRRIFTSLCPHDNTCILWYFVLLFIVYADITVMYTTQKQFRSLGPVSIAQ